LGRGGETKVETSFANPGDPSRLTAHPLAAIGECGTGSPGVESEPSYLGDGEGVVGGTPPHHLLGLFWATVKLCPSQLATHPLAASGELGTWGWPPNSGSAMRTVTMRSRSGRLSCSQHRLASASPHGPRHRSGGRGGRGGAYTFQGFEAIETTRGFWGEGCSVGVRLITRDRLRSWSAGW